MDEIEEELVSRLKAKLTYVVQEQRHKVWIPVEVFNSKAEALTFMLKEAPNAGYFENPLKCDAVVTWEEK